MQKTLHEQIRKTQEIVGSLYRKTRDKIGIEKFAYALTHKRLSRIVLQYVSPQDAVNDLELAFRRLGREYNEYTGNLISLDNASISFTLDKESLKSRVPSMYEMGIYSELEKMREERLASNCKS